MSDASYIYYDSEFEKAFLRKKANSFQDFFADIMEKRYPGDFIRVRPWGAAGDRKNDGYMQSRRTLFQVYAPNDLSERRATSKITEDFQGALPYWKQYFEHWIFVHNSREGLGPGIVAKLLELDSSHDNIRVTAWGYEELLNEFQLLKNHDKAALVGRAVHQKRGMTINGRSGGKYVVNREVGQGGAGIVYEGKVVTAGRCAIKFLHTPFELSDPRDRERFRIEADLLCNKLNSSNIIRGIDYGEHGGNPFLVMEWAGNGALKQKIAENKHDTNLLTKWICQLLKCLRELRSKEVAHRDITSGNILLNDDDDIKLGDLGIAKLLNRDESITLPDDTMGKIPYISPLQRENPSKATGKDDLYSVCVVIYELVTGIPVQPLLIAPLAAQQSSRVPRAFARLVDTVLAFGNDLDGVFEDMCRIYDIDEMVVREHYAIPANRYVSELPAVRVLHLVHDRSYGGIETYVSAIRKYSRHYHDVKSVYGFGMGGYPSNERVFAQAAVRAIAELVPASRNYHQLSEVVKRTTSFLKRGAFHASDRSEADRIIDEFNNVVKRIGGFDVIHSHFILPAYLAGQQRLKALCTSHSLMSEEMRLEDRVLPPGRGAEVASCEINERMHYGGVENVFALCAAHAREVEVLSGRKVAVMKPVMDYSVFLDDSVRNIDSRTARETLEIPNRDTILFVGRPSYRKGVHLLIEAVSDLKRPVQVLIVGRDFTVNHSKATLVFGSQVVKLNPGVSDRILCPGVPKTRQQLALLYKSCDFMVCPSIYEPFGYVNLECMAAKRAVVASDTGGIPEIVRNGITGVLFPSGDVESLRTTIRRLLDDESLRAKLGKNGFDEITSNYRPDECVEELDRYYDRVAVGG